MAASNRTRRGRQRVHVSSIKLHRHDYGQKRRCRPQDVDRPDVHARRRTFLEPVRRLPPDRLVFLEEWGVQLAMYRTHTWVKRGTEYVERVPMNWGRTLTLLGTIRRTGWVVS